jgi:hypothetical protein
MNAPRVQTTLALRRSSDGRVRTSPSAIREAMAALRSDALAGDARASRIYCALWWELTLMNAMSDEEVTTRGRQR